jgi:ABC-type glycerol-3-phosphate transport system substrate-binding protein
MQSLRLAIALGAAAAACHRAPTQPAIRFLHTFGSEETQLFNQVIAERRIAVESSLVPFARGRQVIGEILRAATDCPDLIRIDATWLPELVAGGLLVEPPRALTQHDWSPEATALAQLDGRWWGVPQALDGLLVVRDAAVPAPASPAIADLIAAARAAKTAARRYPLDIRIDGYWFVPWLRDEGGELAAPDGIAGGAAIRAMTRFAQLFGDVAPPPPPPGLEEDSEGRRWRDGEVAYWITGPWQFYQLDDRRSPIAGGGDPDGFAGGAGGSGPRGIDPSRIAVSALAGAPRGGQLLVVPRCAKRADDGWRLADELTSLPVETRFAERFATAPTRLAALTGAPALSRATYEALRGAAMLPRRAATPLLFDDLNAALAAVVAGNAGPDEAVAGVQRAWGRIAQPRRDRVGPRRRGARPPRSAAP